MEKLTGYFDFLCPYCYLGTHYAQLMQQQIDRLIEWLPIEIHADFPPEGLALQEALPHVTDQADRLRKLRTLAGAVNLPIFASNWVPNTKKALQSMEFAREHGKAGLFMPTVFNAYFGAGLDIGKEEVLLALADACGLERDNLQKALQENRYQERVSRNEKDSLDAGVDVVPTLVRKGVKVLEATTTMTFTEYEALFRNIPA